MARAGLLLAAAGSLFSGPVAWGQPAGSRDQSGGIEDIVVTARRITETAQTTPVSISAFSSEDLVTHQITSPLDLERVTPGIYFQNSPSGTGSFAGFRAQTTSTSLQTLAPSIASYENQVYLGNMIGLEEVGLLDVERIEVLKGPQGTLYGRNSTGGAISVYTKQPTDRWEGEVFAEGGNHGMIGGHGILNIPIIKDKVAMRLVAAAIKNDGYARDVRNGTNLRSKKTQFYRGTIGIDPTSDFHISLLGEYSKTEFGGMNPVPLSLTPNSVAALQIALQSGLLTNTAANRGLFLTGQLPTTSAAVQALFNTYKNGINGDKDSVAYLTPQIGHTTTNLFSATMTYDLGWAEIKSITAARNVKEQPTLDFDGLPFTILESDAAHTPLAKFTQWTQEIDLSGKAFKDRLRYSVGAFYLYNKARDTNYSLNFPAVLPGQPTVLDSIQTDKSKALFAQATFALTEKIHATGGARYTEERKSVWVNDFTGVSCLVPPPASLPGPNCVGTFPFSEDKISYTAGMDWAPAEGVLLYVKTDRGYRSGGVNGRTTADPVSVRPFQSEIADNYEIGVKSDLWNRRVRINVDYYYLKAKGLQQSVLVTGSTGPALSLVQNAGRAIVSGVEAEVTVLPMEGVRLQATTAFTEPKYKDFINPANGVDLSGRDFLLVSKWTYSLSGSYTVPVAFGDLTLQADWSWKSSYNLFPSGGAPAFDVQPSYGTLNAQLSLDVKESDVKVTLWTKNLTDKRYLDSMVDAVPGVGFVSGSYAWPRTFGASIRKTF